MKNNDLINVFFWEITKIGEAERLRLKLEDPSMKCVGSVMDRISTGRDSVVSVADCMALRVFENMDIVSGSEYSLFL